MPQKYNLVGKRFGNLKVLEQTERREDRYCVWRCECTCGGEAYVNTKRLLRGTVTDCGCIPKFTARRGSIAEDLSGQHFGEWEVLYRAPNQNKKVMWACRCSCGTTRIIPARDLKMKRTRSCQNIIHDDTRRRRDLTGKKLGSLCPTVMRDYKGTAIEAIGLNRKARSDNQLGVAGVGRTKSGLFRTTIGFQGRKYYLGSYSSIEEAESVYKEAKRALHGRFIKAYTEWMQEGRKNELIFDVNYVNGEFSIQSNYLSK